MKRLGIEASSDLLDQIVAAIDVNNDGVLDVKELVRALKDPSQRRSELLVIPHLYGELACVHTSHTACAPAHRANSPLQDPREAAPPTASDGSGGPGPESPGGDDVEATEPPAAARSLSPLREARDAAAPLVTRPSGFLEDSLIQKSRDMHRKGAKGRAQPRKPRSPRKMQRRPQALLRKVPMP